MAGVVFVPTKIGGATSLLFDSGAMYGAPLVGVLCCLVSPGPGGAPFTVHLSCGLFLGLRGWSDFGSF